MDCENLARASQNSDDVDCELKESAQVTVNYELVTVLATPKSVVFSCNQVTCARNSFKATLILQQIWQYTSRENTSPSKHGVAYMNILMI